MNSVDIKFEDFGSICRLCLVKDLNLIDIFTCGIESVDIRDSESETISEMINKYFGIKVTVIDELPRCICSDCLEVLNHFYKFRKNFLKSQEMLKEILNLHVKQELDDDKSEYEMDDNCIESFLYYDYNEDSLINPEVKIEIKKESEGSETEQIVKSNKFSSEKNNDSDLNEEFKYNKFKMRKKRGVPPTKKEMLDRQRLRASTPCDCEFCGKKFHSYHSLRYHVDREHDRFRLKCEHCGKAFLFKSYLERHLNFKHNEGPKKEIKCDICQKNYSNIYLLNDHRAYVHFNQLNYHCTICKKEFGLLSGLRKHERSTHNEDYTKLIECHICGKQLKALSMIKHKKIHAEIKPHKCEYCPKTFSVKQTLIQHLRTHTKERPYVCHHCGSAFTQRTPLMVHLKKLHSDKIKKEN